MAVKIRLKRGGKRNAACYRIVVADVRSARDGKAVEELGFYNPKTKEENINVERYDYWMSVGALQSDTVAGIAKRAKAGVSLEKPAPKGITAPTPKKKEEPVAETEAVVGEAPAEA